MKYSIEQKKKSRLQGHRKRRRKINSEEVEKEKVYLSWTDYKAIRQYQTMGDILDEIRCYGYENLTENFYSSESKGEGTRNGYLWLTKEE